jgi:hypothetical protein
MLLTFLVLGAVIGITFMTHPRTPETTNVDAALYLKDAPTLNIVVTATTQDAAVRAVESLGGQALGTAGTDGMLAATLPAGQLDALAIHPGIRSIRANNMVTSADDGGPTESVNQ